MKTILMAEVHLLQFTPLSRQRVDMTLYTTSRLHCRYTCSYCRSYIIFFSKGVFINIYNPPGNVYKNSAQSSSRYFGDFNLPNIDLDAGIPNSNKSNSHSSFEFCR